MKTSMIPCLAEQIRSSEGETGRRAGGAQERLPSKAARPLGIVSGVLLLVGSGLAQTTELVSVHSSGNQGNSYSELSSISGDGRYVAFDSYASNLVPGDTNGDRDVFVHDRQTGVTKRVSVTSSGIQGKNESLFPSISGDGRCVAFFSFASNLVPGDTNGQQDVFVHDCQTGVTERVSVDSSGSQGYGPSDFPSISGDGRYVAFGSGSNLATGDTNGWYDVFVHDRQTGVTELVSVDSSGSQGNSPSTFPSISGDGRYVAFDSWATNLVPGDTNGGIDIFVHDRQTGATERASVNSSGNQGNGWSQHPSISGDGRYVPFESYSSNLVPGDTNGSIDVFVHDRQTGATERANVDSSGNQGNAGALRGSISGDGRYVAFESYSSNLVPGDTNGTDDVFVHDRQTGVTERVSLDFSGNQADGWSNEPSISEDGRCVAFDSSASNLVPGDTNGTGDVFVRDRGCGSGSLSYCTAGISASGCQPTLISTGTASATAGSGFTVLASGMEGLKDGTIFFGQNGQQANSWGNGTSFQCIVPPVHRAGTLSGNGSNGVCNQTLSQDLNAQWCPTCPKPNHAPTPGVKLQVQLWYRDPANTSNQSTSLTDALEVDICP